MRVMIENEKRNEIVDGIYDFAWIRNELQSN